MDGRWSDLERHLWQANGADFQLDQTLAKALDLPDAAYTASVDACRALVAAVLPGWRLHVGFGATGTFPCASLTLGERCIVSDGPTVPLAILRSAVAARIAAEATAPEAPPPP